MPFAVDLHMHSCLSPCGDEDMTPNNIVGMAKLKGLDAIALTDHNAWQNLPAIASVAREAGIILLPGLEVTTREEVHMLCYFPQVEAACAFGVEVQNKLPPIENMPMIFGEQVIMDENDERTGIYGKLLLQACDLGTDEILPFAASFGGICVPAHINRTSNSIVSNLGFLPLDMPYAAVEVYPKLPCDVNTGEYRILRSSDAHYLGDMLERESFLRYEEPTLNSLFAYLKQRIRTI